MERCRRCYKIVPNLRNHQCEQPSRSDDDDGGSSVLGAAASLLSDDGDNGDSDGAFDASD